MSEFGVRGNRVSGKNVQFKMVPLPRSGVFLLSSLILGFSVLLQLNVLLFYLNLIVYKYKRQIILSLLKRCLNYAFPRLEHRVDKD